MVFRAATPSGVLPRKPRRMVTGFLNRELSHSFLMGNCGADPKSKSKSTPPPTRRQVFSRLCVTASMRHQRSLQPNSLQNPLIPCLRFFGFDRRSSKGLRWVRRDCSMFVLRISRSGSIRPVEAVACLFFTAGIPQGSAIRTVRPAFGRSVV